ncbi:MAG TPA: hypothetical protein PLO69_08620 [Gammaproteobacteria bacterium]|nr:hypothetical protein [Gammaproteobacteria bacterium]
MIALIDGFLSSRLLVLYVLVLSLARGLLFPDFRHGVISIIVIQIIYPAVLFAPMIMKLHGEHFWGYYFICIWGIMLAALVALIRYYFLAGRENLVDGLSVPIFIFSFAVQVGVYSAFVISSFLATKIKQLG